LRARLIRVRLRNLDIAGCGVDARDIGAKAREWFDLYPKAAYMTEIESWRVLPEDRIEFTIRRLPTAD
jgi:hypothetical protein